MQYSFIMAIVVTCVAVWALVKRYETRLVLLTAGLVMALLSFDPMMAFKQFDKSMTNSSLIIAICSAMGFAAVVSLTKCDLHLVALLTKPLKRLGLLLFPACSVVTGVVSIAIPSTAGCCAAIAPTLIPLMIRAGFKPAAAAAAVVGSITPALLNPGVSHNAFIAKIADIPVMDYVIHFWPQTVGLSLLVIVVMTVTAFAMGDYKAPKGEAAASNVEVKTQQSANLPQLPEKANVIWAIAPLVPVVLLIGFSLYAPQLKMSVATAMLLGTIYALAVTRTNPADVTKRFFDGMGKGYANILGIIIAAGVFAAGLRAAGVIDAFIAYLQNAQSVALFGGAFGPYVLAILTGSGDAAAFAFNEAVTPHAASFGMTIESLGYLAEVSANFGRLSSPLAGGMILVAGIAGVSPLEIVKRTAPALFAALLVLMALVYYA